MRIFLSLSIPTVDLLKVLVSHFIWDFFEFLNKCVLMSLGGKDLLDDIHLVILNSLDNIVHTRGSHQVIPSRACLKMLEAKLVSLNNLHRANSLALTGLFFKHIFKSKKRLGFTGLWSCKSRDRRSLSVSLSREESLSVPPISNWVFIWFTIG